MEDIGYSGCPRKKDNESVQRKSVLEILYFD